MSMINVATSASFYCDSEYLTVLATDGREDETKTGKFKQMFTKKDGTTGPNTYPHTIYPGGFDIENFTPHKVFEKKHKSIKAKT